MLFPHGNDFPGNRQTAFDWQGAHVTDQLFSNKRAESERHQDFGLTPREARLPTAGETVWRAAGYFCHLLTAISARL